MTLLLPPTIDRVLEAERDFDSDPETLIDECALAKLFKTFPENTDPTEVLFKAAALNALYSTNIYALRPVSRHIVDRCIDPLLAIGSPDALDLIADFRHLGKRRHIFSFATKYCSWHKPDCYPIYDRFVDCSLRAYRKQECFTSFVDEDLRCGASFVRVVTAFRDFYKLHAVTFKQLDKFLWRQGRTLANTDT